MYSKKNTAKNIPEKIYQKKYTKKKYTAKNIQQKIYHKKIYQLSKQCSTMIVLFNDT